MQGISVKLLYMHEQRHNPLNSHSRQISLRGCSDESFMRIGHEALFTLPLLWNSVVAAFTLIEDTPLFPGRSNYVRESNTRRWDVEIPGFSVKS